MRTMRTLHTLWQQLLTHLRCALSLLPVQAIMYCWSGEMPKGNHPHLCQDQNKGLTL